MNKQDKTYSIGTVARMTRIPKYKIRHWYDRHLTNIQRIQIGDSYHRRFTDEDIALINKIKEYRMKGFTLEGAVDHARKGLMARKK